MSELQYVNPEYKRLLAQAGLADLDSWLATQDGERLDKAGLESWRQRWRIRVPRSDGAVATFYLKRFVSPPLRRQWRRWWDGGGGLSTAGVEFDNAQRLHQAGIPAAQVAAFGQRMIGPAERCSAVLLGEVPGESLERWVPREWPSLRGDWRQRRALLNTLATLIAGFHSQGFVHRDLYLCHIFIDPSAQPAALRLIDLQRVFRPRWRMRRWVVKDLAALNYSAPPGCVTGRERLWFLCRYAQARGVSDIRGLLGEVHGKTARMTRRQAR